MTLNIIDIRSALSEEWDHIWSNCGYATYFHSREWAEVWQAYTQKKTSPEPVILKFNDGKKVLLPISVYRSVFHAVCYGISSPAGTFGGWISADDLGEAHGQVLFRHVYSQYKNLIWRLNPYGLFMARPEKGYSLKEDKTYTLNLTRGFQDIQSKWKENNNGSILRKVQKAREAGLKVYQAQSLEKWEEYYRVYQSSWRRWKEKFSAPYPWRLFELLFQKQSTHTKLWLADFEGKTVAGALCFYSKKHSVYWHGAALNDFFHLRPMNLIMFEAIQNACEKGKMWFDFNPSGGHSGVEQFKRSFSPEVFSCPVFVKESAVLSLLRNVRKLFKGAIS